MTVFELVKQEVTAEDVARLYGLKFGRSGRATCPWHDDADLWGPLSDLLAQLSAILTL